MVTSSITNGLHSMVWDIACWYACSKRFILQSLGLVINVSLECWVLNHLAAVRVDKTVVKQGHFVSQKALRAGQRQCSHHDKPNSLRIRHVHNHNGMNSRLGHPK